MSWIKVLILGLTIMKSILDYLRESKRIEEADARALARQLEKSNEILTRALNAKRSASDMPTQQDRFNRDNDSE